MHVLTDSIQLVYKVYIKYVHANHTKQQRSLIAAGRAVLEDHEARTTSIHNTRASHTAKRFLVFIQQWEILIKLPVHASKSRPFCIA